MAMSSAVALGVESKVIPFLEAGLTIVLLCVETLVENSVEFFHFLHIGSRERALGAQFLMTLDEAAHHVGSILLSESCRVAAGTMLGRVLVIYVIGAVRVLVGRDILNELSSTKHCGKSLLEELLVEGIAIVLPEV